MQRTYVRACVRLVLAPRRVKLKEGRETQIRRLRLLFESPTHLRCTTPNDCANRFKCIHRRANAYTCRVIMTQARIALAGLFCNPLQLPLTLCVARKRYFATFFFFFYCAPGIRPTVIADEPARVYCFSRKSVIKYWQDWPLFSYLHKRGVHASQLHLFFFFFACSAYNATQHVHRHSNDHLLTSSVVGI